MTLSDLNRPNSPLFLSLWSSVISLDWLKLESSNCCVKTKKQGSVYGMNIVLVTINNQSVNSRNITIKLVQFDRVILEKNRWCVLERVVV